MKPSAFKMMPALLVIVGVLIVGSVIILVLMPRVSYNYDHMSLGHLVDIGFELREYEEDHSGVLPKMDNIESFRSALSPYTKDPSIFIRPPSKQPYAVNGFLSEARISSFKRPEEVVVAYEQKPAKDGTIGVLFLNFHAARISPVRWGQLAKTSKLPETP